MHHTTNKTLHHFGFNLIERRQLSHSCGLVNFRSLHPDWKVKEWTLGQTIDLFAQFALPLHEEDIAFIQSQQQDSDPPNPSPKGSGGHHRHVIDNFLEGAKNLVLFAEGGLVVDFSRIANVSRMDDVLQTAKARHVNLYARYDKRLGGYSRGFVAFAPSFRRSFKQSFCDMVNIGVMGATAFAPRFASPNLRYSEEPQELIWKRAATFCFQKESRKLLRHLVDPEVILNNILKAGFADRPVADVCLCPRLYVSIKYRSAGELEDFLAKYPHVAMIECQDWTKWARRNGEFVSHPVLRSWLKCYGDNETCSEPGLKSRLLASANNKLVTTERFLRNSFDIDVDLYHQPILAIVAGCVLALLILYIFLKLFI